MLSNTYTLEDLRARVGMLRVFFEHSFYGADEKGREPQVSKIDEILKDENKYHKKALKALGSEFFKSFNYKNTNSILNYFLENANSLPRFVLYSPTLISENKKEEIGKMIKGEISENCLMEILVDENIVGGCGFVWQNKYYDLSLQYFIEKNKKEILNFIKGYARELR